jgi:transcriptional regulator GlxA family with amidase domain
MSQLSPGRLLGLAVALMCEFASAVAQGNHVPNAAETILSDFDTYLSTTYAQAISLKDIARGIGVSRQHLMKICREAGRPTPTQQLYRKRLEVAADLLRHTGFPLSQIAEQCGFAKPFHFSRKYKDFCGESPLSWRHKQWESGARPDATQLR